MNVTELTFGVEIETTIPAGSLDVGPHNAGYPIPSMPGWLADRDPSIDVTYGRMACEFVSPVLKGPEGLRELMATVRKIKALGGKVNKSCGLHVHIGFDKSNVGNVAKFATLVANFEKAIYAASGTKRRERGRWCRSIQQHGQAELAVNASRRDRYHVANFGTGKPTVEIRAFSASLNPVKIASDVRLCLALVERSLTMSRATNWTAKAPSPTSPIHRAGEGQTALTRLFYQMGWIKGRQKHAFGNLEGEGLPTLRASRKALMAMARKYDNER